MATPDAQYIVDIAAEMPEGEATIKELEKLSSELTGAGKESDQFQQAMKMASEQMGKLQSNAKTAAEALAVGQKEFDRLESAAVRAGKAQEKAIITHERASKASATAAEQLANYAPKLAALESSAQSATRAALQSGDAQGELAEAARIAAEQLALAREEHDRLSRNATKAARAEERAAARISVTAEQATEAKAALNAYTPELQKLEKASEEATAAQEKQAATMKKIEKLSKVVDESFDRNKRTVDAYKGALDVVGGPFNRMVSRVVDGRSKFIELSAQVGESRAGMAFLAAGALSVAAGFAAAGAAGAALTATLVGVAVGIANTRREAGLTREALSALHPEFAAASAEFDAINDATGVSEERLIGLTNQLKGAKVHASQIPAALRALAKAEVALGQGGAAEFVAQLQTGRLSVEQLSGVVERKFGGIVERRLMSLGSLGGRLKDNLADIFGGLDIDPLLRGLDRLVGMLDESHAVGMAAKHVFEDIFGPLVEGSEGAAVKLEEFVLDSAIFLMRGYVEFKKFRLNMKLTWRDIKNDISDAIDAAEELVGPRMFQLGKDMLRGAIKGIASMAFPLSTALVDAFVGAGKEVDKKLERRSPSKEYERRTSDVMAGAIRGIEKNEDEYKDTLEHALRPSIKGERAYGMSMSSSTSHTSNTSSSTGVNLAGANFNLYGVKDAEHGRDLIEEMFTKLLRGDAAKLAGATP